MRRLGDQAGQTAAEYLGLLLVVSAVISVIAASGLREAITARISLAICQVASDIDCAEDRERLARSQAEQRERARRNVPSPDPASVEHAASARDLGLSGRPVSLRASEDRSGAPGRAETALAAGASQGFGPSSQDPAAGVPGAPAPPPAPPDNLDGSGRFDSENRGFLADVKNEAIEAAALVGADVFEVTGRQDAARHMRHFLDASGEPLEVDPPRMLRDISDFGADERDIRNQMIREVRAEAARRYDGGALSFTVDDRGWDLIDSNRDVLGDNWFYALGGFSYTHTAAVQVRPPERSGDPPRVEIDYKLHVFDRYNWDKGKKIPGLPVSDEDLQELHRAGMAQDFEVGGSTQTQTVTVEGDPSTDSAPPPPTPPADRRDGERTDHGRERGSG